MFFCKITGTAFDSSLYKTCQICHSLQIMKYDFIVNQIGYITLDIKTSNLNILNVKYLPAKCLGLI